MSVVNASSPMANLDIEPQGVRDSKPPDRMPERGGGDDGRVEGAATTDQPDQAETPSVLADRPARSLSALHAPVTVARTVRSLATLPAPVAVERPAPLRALPSVPIVTPPVAIAGTQDDADVDVDVDVDVDAGAGAGAGADSDEELFLNLDAVPLNAGPRPLLIEPPKPVPPRPVASEPVASEPDPPLPDPPLPDPPQPDPPLLRVPVPRPVAVPRSNIPEVVTRAVGELLSRAAGTAPATTWTAEPSLYLNDPFAVARYAAVVAEHVVAGRPPVPYFMQDATDGMAVEGRGDLTFGVRIPFVLPAGVSAEERAALRQAIVADLWHQGLIRQVGLG
jgi:hypothetical protein